MLQEVRSLLADQRIDEALMLLRSEIDNGRVSVGTYSGLIERLVALSNGTARAQDYGLPIERHNRPPTVFVACLPKSGSTFLTHTIADALKLQHTYCFYEAHQNEQELHIPALLRGLAKPAVVQQHVRATERNIQLIQAFGLRPIVLVRDIFDALVSMRDMIRVTDEPVFFDKTFKDLPETIQVELVVRKYAFWYLEFYVSWVRAHQNNRLDCMILSYEDLIADKVKAIDEVIRHSGLHASQESIQISVSHLEDNPKLTRKNQGSKGRGGSVSAALRKEVLTYTRFFPDINFVPLGLH